MIETRFLSGARSSYHESTETPPQLEFRILGRLEVRSGEHALPLGGPKPRVLLALLVLNANRALPRERIVDELWGEPAPATAHAVLSTYASRFRRLFAADREIALLTDTGGYVLRVPPERVDAGRFEELVGEGRRALAANDPERAARVEREALALWRGAPLADLDDTRFAHAEVARLEELHVSALEDRVEADLALGRHADVVGELEALVVEHPYRERLRGQLMLALYRSGRQVEALAAYRSTRRVLVDELGIEPSRGLQQLEAKILRQDPSLEPPEPVSTNGGQARTPVARRFPVRPRGAAAFGLAAALALVSAVYAFALRPAEPPTAVTLAGDSVAVVDPDSGTVSGEIPVGGRPGGLAVGAGSVWVGNRDDRTLLRIDPASRRITRTIGLAIAPTVVTVGAGSVWVASNYERVVVRVDPDVGGVVATVRIPGPREDCCISDVEIGPHAVWVSHSGFLTRIDPRTNAVGKTTRTNVGGIAVGVRAVWGLNGHGIVRIDPATNDVVDTIGTERFGRVTDCRELATGGGAPWVTSSEGGTLWKIDPNEDRLSRIVALGRRSVGLAVGRGAVWVAAADANLLRIDVRTGQVQTIPLGVYAFYRAIAVGEGAVWMSVTTI